MPEGKAALYHLKNYRNELWNNVSSATFPKIRKVFFGKIPNLKDS